MKEKIKHIDRKTALGLVAGILWIGVLTAIGKTLYDIGLIDPSVVISSFIGVGLVAVICGIILYRYVWKKLNNSMMGGFL